MIWSNLEKIMDHAAVLFSFEQIGGAQASLDMANTYAKERRKAPWGSYKIDYSKNIIMEAQFNNEVCKTKYSCFLDIDSRT